MGEHYLVREAEAYSASETDQLRAIRSHRNRRREWRHMIRVRRIRKSVRTTITFILVILAIWISRDVSVALIYTILFAGSAIAD